MIKKRVYWLAWDTCSSVFLTIFVAPVIVLEILHLVPSGTVSRILEPLHAVEEERAA